MLRNRFLIFEFYRGAFRIPCFTPDLALGWSGYSENDTEVALRPKAGSEFFLDVFCLLFSPDFWCWD